MSKSNSNNNVLDHINSLYNTFKRENASEDMSERMKRLSRLKILRSRVASILENDKEKSMILKNFKVNDYALIDKEIQENDPWDIDNSATFNHIVAKAKLNALFLRDYRRRKFHPKLGEIKEEEDSTTDMNDADQIEGGRRRRRRKSSKKNRVRFTGRRFTGRRFTGRKYRRLR
jgi:hypothetical protein